MKSIFIYLFAAIPFFAQGQVKSDSLLNGLIFFRNHFSVSLIPNLTHKAKVTRQQGKTELLSKPGFGFQGGFNYTLNLKKKWGVETGIHMGVVPYRFSFSIPEEFLLVSWGELELHTAIYDIAYYAYPLLLNYRRVLPQKKMLFITKAGINLRYYPDGSTSGGVSYELDSITKQEIHVFDMNIDVNHNRKVVINYNFGIGLMKTLRYGMVEVNLICNLALDNNIFKGDYWFSTANDYTTGNYQLNASYIGLEIGYVFVKTKYN